MVRLKIDFKVRANKTSVFKLDAVVTKKKDSRRILFVWTSKRTDSLFTVFIFCVPHIHRLTWRTGASWTRLMLVRDWISNQGLSLFPRILLPSTPAFCLLEAQLKWSRPSWAWQHYPICLLLGRILSLHPLPCNGFSSRLKTSQLFELTMPPDWDLPHS